MRFLTEAELKAFYPEEGAAGKGTYGRVYKSGNHVVKQSDQEHQYALLVELDMLANMKHPYIIQPDAFSFAASAIVYPKA